MDDSLSESNSEELIIVSKEEEARLALKNELPDYVVESFMATGYDTLQVISKMDTSRNPGNSLQEVEEFISTEFAGDPHFQRGVTSNGTFKFLPGHRQRIVDFVEANRKKLDQEEKAKRLNCKRSSGKSNIAIPFKQKMAKSDTNLADTNSSKSNDGLNQAKAVAMVRQQICKWQREGKNPNHLTIKDFKENEHFEVKSVASEDTDSSCSGPNFRVYIYCTLCHKNYTLGFKDGGALLSNYTRHIPKCIKNNLKTSKDNTIHNFFTPKTASKADSKCSQTKLKAGRDDVSDFADVLPTENPCLPLPEQSNTSSSCPSSSVSPGNVPTLTSVDKNVQIDSIKCSTIPKQAMQTQSNNSDSTVPVFRIPPPARS